MKVTSVGYKGVPMGVGREWCCEVWMGGVSEEWCVKGVWVVRESLCSTNTGQLIYTQVLWFDSFITPSQSLYSTNNITTTHCLTQQAVRIITAPLFTSPCSVLHPYPPPLRRWRLDRTEHITHAAQPESLQKQDALHEYITYITGHWVEDEVMHNHDIAGISTQQSCAAMVHCTDITVVTARYILLQAFKNELHCILSWHRNNHTGVAIRMEHAIMREGWIDSNERNTLCDMQYQLFMDSSHGQWWRNDDRRNGVNLHEYHRNRNSTGSTISRARQNMQLVPGMNRSTTATGDRGCSFISSHCPSHSFNLRNIHTHLHR